jgi:hypothetical protein
MTQRKKEFIGSILMWVSLAATLVYLILAIVVLFDTLDIKDGFEQLGALIALRYLMPFTICMVVNFFLTGVGAISKNWIVTLISCILYFVSILLVPERFYCSTLQGILSLIAIFMFFNRGRVIEEDEDKEEVVLPDLPIQD